MKKICVVTGSRAEYGLLRWVMEGIRNSPKLKLQIIVTGMHLSSKFGQTEDFIELDNFKIDYKVYMDLNSDTSESITKSMGTAMIGFADALTQLKPDMLLILGDRYEILVAAIAAMMAKIPIVHLHGGELTEGAFDDTIRHSITKMSHLHFVATDEYRNRVIQLGEQPDRVFNVGALGIDNIYKLKLLNKKELEDILDFKFFKKNLLITFHPVTLELNTSNKYMDELLQALSQLKETGLIFTMPNSDIDNKVIFKKINNFCDNNQYAKCYTSLGQLRYLSCVKYVDAVIGNSSSGLLEIPSFKKGTINIGDRQRGRLRSQSVINCEPECSSIIGALKHLYSEEFQSLLPGVINPYKKGKGNASEEVVKIIETKSQINLLKKYFYNL
jgi:GDP/UDP-N,N'-diacetylbacillosamine 2-epimerase (hydrolysing)